MLILDVVEVLSSQQGIISYKGAQLRCMEELCGHQT